MDSLNKDQEDFNGKLKSILDSLDFCLFTICYSKNSEEVTEKACLAHNYISFLYLESQKRLGRF